MLNIDKKYYIHSSNEKILVYFDEKRKTVMEKVKQQLLSNKILTFYQRLYNKNAQFVSMDFFYADFAGYGYLNEIGYYKVMYDLGGYYEISSYGEDIDTAFIEIICSMLEKMGYLYEKQNRKELKQEFKKRFCRLNYDKLVIQAEYDLAMWDKYFDGKISEKVINRYQNYLAVISSLGKGSNGMYSYDVDNKKVIYNVNSKVRKLKK